MLSYANNTKRSSNGYRFSGDKDKIQGNAVLRISKHKSGERIKLHSVKEGGSGVSQMQAVLIKLSGCPPTQHRNMKETCWKDRIWWKWETDE